MGRCVEKDKDYNTSIGTSTAHQSFQPRVHRNELGRSRKHTDLLLLPFVSLWDVQGGLGFLRYKTLVLPMTFIFHAAAYLTSLQEGWLLFLRRKKGAMDVSSPPQWVPGAAVLPGESHPSCPVWQQQTPAGNKHQNKPVTSSLSPQPGNCCFALCSQKGSCVTVHKLI